ncbi:MAG TPA: hypothetical protein VFX16_30900 [Pseudonocardiaceae bacterium]|nr:hypothetical protein [Pseudonocardiaceae bacterium]
MSPVSKGRKRKPCKGVHKTGARYDRSDFARTPGANPRALGALGRDT